MDVRGYLGDMPAGRDTRNAAVARVLDHGAFLGGKARALAGEQVDLGVGLKRAALVAADGVVQHVGDTGDIHQLVNQLTIGRARDGTLHAALVQLQKARVQTFFAVDWLDLVSILIRLASIRTK